jgi:demethylmenaquinone methyltransferase/2-methoxy-6-polyprenyl-1,4-benzoquinol methylase
MSAEEIAGPAGDGQVRAAQIRAMFARIVPRYDLVNSAMTFGMDRRWRRAAIAMVEPRGGVALDVATGTGELAFELRRQGARRVVGLDFCQEMLDAAKQKPADIGLNTPPSGYVAGDALTLPFVNDSFDALVNGFLLRNLVDLPQALREFYRVLKPGGRLACLDVTHPPLILRPFCLAYFNWMVPIIGGVLSGDYSAYRYLPNSLRRHPNARQLAAMMTEAGFSDVSYRLFNFGLIAIHTGRKREPSTDSEQFDR